MFINIIPGNKKENRGYSILEVLAAITIVGIMSAVLLADYSSNRQSIFLKQATGQVIADLRTAQNMAMNTAKFNGQIPSGGYGIHFNPLPSASYVIYADVNADGIYADPAEKFISRNLDNKIQISSFAVNEVNLNDINFIPPDPKVCFDRKSPVAASFCPDGMAPGFSAVITLRYGADGLEKTITVNGITGQITGN